MIDHPAGIPPLHPLGDSVLDRSLKRAVVDRPTAYQPGGRLQPVVVLKKSLAAG